MNRKLLGITGVLALAISLIAVGSITAIGSAVEEKETAQSPLHWSVDRGIILASIPEPEFKCFEKVYIFLAVNIRSPEIC